MTQPHPSRPRPRTSADSGAQRVPDVQPTTPSTARPILRLDRSEERRLIRDLIARILDACPRRTTGSDCERRAHQIVREVFEQRGVPVEEQGFEFNESLYANIALHFGLGTLGTAVSGLAPLLGLLLHLTAAGSYWAESTRRAYILRRLFRWKPSRNLLATLPATEPLRRRIVIIAHVDAAFTGWLFDPKTIERFAGDPPPGLGFIRRSLALATRTQFALAGFDLLRIFLGPLTWPLRPLEWTLNLPALLAFLINLEVVLRDEVVPGANDDLSGVAGLVVLLHRLAQQKPADVELVFGALGAEESSLGGGDALARAMEGRWERDKTVILGLDCLANGDLRYLHPEGEVVQVPVPAWLRRIADGLAQREPRFAEVTPFEIPVGGTDVAAFLNHGWDGLCLTCIDPQIGSPRNYHHPSDDLAHLDLDKVLYSIDYAEALIRELMDEDRG